MDHLPVEILTSILVSLLEISRRGTTHSRPYCKFFTPDPTEPIIFQWIEQDPRSRALFPFNVASVSKLWQDILARIPECWTRIVFDVAKDPAPLLDAFSWSKGQADIEVLVFKSTEPSNAERGVDGELEKERVSRIVQALAPHVHRFKSVEFDVTYSSSLPSPTIFFRQDHPNLQNLSLNCLIDDIVVGEQPCATSVAKDRIPFGTAFPKLGTLSLTGFWFMHLAHAARTSKWFSRLKVRPCMELYISHFQFVEVGHYSLDQFVRCLCKFRGCGTYYFRDLSLAYTYHGPELEFHEDYKIVGNIHFHSVSYDFLFHLYAISEVDSDESLSFESCRIPEIYGHWQHAYFLELTNIDADSLRHILEVWCGSELRILSCPFFDDAFLSWLGTEVDFTAPHGMYIFFRASGLRSLDISDCPNFTPRALRSCIKARNDAALVADLVDDCAISSLGVSGNVPVLSQEDKDWFFENVEAMEYWRTDTDVADSLSVNSSA